MVGSLSSGHDGRHTFGGGPSGDWTPMNRCGDTPGANFISEKFLDSKYTTAAKSGAADSDCGVKLGAENSLTLHVV
eukprot:COSAG01_NODE_17424_length_1152_cov_2.389364_2_plen_76_part_00